jgi:hypothetical protein
MLDMIPPDKTIDKVYQFAMMCLDNVSQGDIDEAEKI